MWIYKAFLVLSLMSDCSCLRNAGLNILLISRTQAKLEAAAKEIETSHRVETKVVAADFSSVDRATWTSIQGAIASLDVGILINNVGLSYDHAEYLDEVDEQLIDDLVQINVIAATKASLYPTFAQMALLCNH